MPPKKSMSQVYADAHGRQHRRAKSGTATPSASPRATAGGHMKRNSSHAVLPKNRSHGNLRKNQSTNTLTVLNRNLSRGALNKLGAPAEQKARKAARQKQGVFDLGDGSSGDEDDAEWEDSTASPELTRNNTRNNSANASNAPTPSRPQTPTGEPTQKPPDRQLGAPGQKTSSPPEPSLLKGNKSAPDLRYDRGLSADRPRQDPALLTQNGRASRAPPAITTATARSSQQQLPRTESQTSLVKSSRTSLEASQETAQSAKTPSTPGVGTIGTSSSGSAPVSHFLHHDAHDPEPQRPTELADDHSLSDFMITYKPQPSESPEKPRTVLHRARLPGQPSRTQQKLELQRREAMRGHGPPPSSGAGMALSAGSSVSLHSRSASKGRPRSVAGDYKAIKQDYETAIKQLTVVRRFRNPVLESLHRLKQNQSLGTEGGAQPPPKHEQKRPPSRRGQVTGPPTPRPSSTVESTPAATPPDQSKTISFRPSETRPSHGRDSRVTFQLSRQGSHEDILTTSQDCPEVHHDEINDGLSPKEALIRRMWESRIYAA